MSCQGTCKCKQNTKLQVKIINEGVNPLPKYETPLSAGMDLRADFSNTFARNLKGQATINRLNDNYIDSIILEPGWRVLIPTRLKIELPAGYEAQIRPRSGLALKHGLTVLNSPGTIDAK